MYSKTASQRYRSKKPKSVATLQQKKRIKIIKSANCDLRKIGYCGECEKLETCDIHGAK